MKVYVATVGPGLPVKVGVSRNPEQRMKQLRCPVTGKRPRVVVSVIGSPRSEAIVHDAMTRHRLKGEWYDAMALPRAIRMVELSERNPGALLLSVCVDGLLNSHPGGYRVNIRRRLAETEAA